MDSDDRAGGTPLGADPEVIKYTNHYVRRLLAEYPYVYAALYNPGGSVILTSTGLIDADRTYEYTSQIGNPFHLDLIQLSIQMEQLSKKEREALYAWAEGLTPLEAARYLHATGPVALRKRRERGIHALRESFNDEKADREGTGTAGNVPAGTGCTPPSGDGAQAGGDIAQDGGSPQ
jgi:hypothetical protein